MLKRLTPDKNDTVKLFWQKKNLFYHNESPRTIKIDIKNEPLDAIFSKQIICFDIIQGYSQLTNNLPI